MKNKYKKEIPEGIQAKRNQLGVEPRLGRREAARSHDINANMLGRWIKEQQVDDGKAFRGNGMLTPEQEEIREMKTLVRKLQMEKDILKTATVCVL